MRDVINEKLGRNQDETMKRRDVIKVMDEKLGRNPDHVRVTKCLLLDLV